MPQPSCHLQLSREILDGWTDNPSDSPFDSNDPPNRTAFLHGSLGPDMGFFPGCGRYLAKLGHRAPVGDFARELVQLARTERELAFAYGWVLHILLDAFVHPLINAAAARRLGLRLEETTYAELEHTHIRLEIGLDLIVHRRHIRLHRLRLDPVLDEASLSFLARAHTLVHGVHVSSAEFAMAHRKLSQIIGPMLRLQATMSYARVDCGSAVITPAIWSVRCGLSTLQAVATRVKGEDSPTAAFLAPLGLDTDLLQKIDEAVARCRLEFQSHVDCGLATLPNYNVDTGAIEPVYGESAA